MTEYANTTNFMRSTGFILLVLNGHSTVELYEIPTFQMLFFNFSAGFAISCIWATFLKQWTSILNLPFSVWAVGILGLFCNVSAYTTAFKLAPAAQVDLIYYLWPLFTICLTQILQPLFSGSYIAGALLGFAGVFFLIFNEPKTSNSFRKALWAMAMRFLPLSAGPAILSFPEGIPMLPRIQLGFAAESPPFYR